MISYQPGPRVYPSVPIYGPVKSSRSTAVKNLWMFMICTKRNAKYVSSVAVVAFFFYRINILNIKSLTADMICFICVSIYIYINNIQTPCDCV